MPSTGIEIVLLQLKKKNSSLIGTRNNCLNSQERVNVSPTNNSSNAWTSDWQLLSPGRIILQKIGTKKEYNFQSDVNAWRNVVDYLADTRNTTLINPTHLVKKYNLKKNKSWNRNLSKTNQRLADF